MVPESIFSLFHDSLCELKALWTWAFVYVMCAVWVTGTFCARTTEKRTSWRHRWIWGAGDTGPSWWQNDVWRATTSLERVWNQNRTSLTHSKLLGEIIVCLLGCSRFHFDSEVLFVLSHCYAVIQDCFSSRSSTSSSLFLKLFKQTEKHENCVNLKK